MRHESWQTLSAAPYGRNVPQFTWGAPLSPPAIYVYRISVQSNNGGWNYPQNDGLPSGTLSAVYNADGRANPASLVTGTPYSWAVDVQDRASRNTATYQAPAYTP